MLVHYNKDIYRSCQHCHCVTEIKKGLKEDPSVCNSVLNFYKIKIEPTLKYILYGRKIKNIEFLQTFIDLLWTKYLEWKTSKGNVVKFCKKLLKFT